MRRWQLAELGEPAEKLHVVEVAEPDLQPEQLLVATKAVGLSFPDVLMCRGEYQMPTPPDFTPGGESAGEVIAVGAEAVLVEAQARQRGLQPDGRRQRSGAGSTEVVPRQVEICQALREAVQCRRERVRAVGADPDVHEAQPRERGEQRDGRRQLGGTEVVVGQVEICQPS